MYSKNVLQAFNSTLRISTRTAAKKKPNTLKELYQHPHDWHKIYPIAAGRNQSPVDLLVEDTKVCKKQSFPNLSLKFDPKTIKSVVNKNFSVTFNAKGQDSVISGGPLKNDHHLLQFHFHWGSKDHFGSEHTLNGKKYSAELHLVHQNAKYNCFNEALEHHDGLCVLGVFLQVGNNPNTAYDAVAEAMSHVKNPQSSYELPSGIDTAGLLPKSKEYVYYNGSLTTPPLKECVQWINFIEPVTISKEHILALRSLCCDENGEHTCIVDNFRPTQPLHNRTLNYCHNK